MLYVTFPDNLESVAVTQNSVQADGVKYTVDATGPARNRTHLAKFLKSTQNEKEKTFVAAKSDDLEWLWKPVIEDLLSVSGGHVCLVSASELTDNPRSLLSGCLNAAEEVLAKSSKEVLEYFNQAVRARDSISIRNAALLSVSRNGYSLNFVIYPPGQNATPRGINSSAALLVLTDSNLDVAFFKFHEMIKSTKDVKRGTARSIRKEISELNKDLSRQKRADNEQRKNMLSLLTRLNTTKEVDEDARIAAAKKFMAVRAQKLQRNGLMWALESKETDHDVKLAKEYQTLRLDLESARTELARIKNGGDARETNLALIQVRAKESNLAACDAKIQNDSVKVLHHQLRSKREAQRTNHASNISKLQQSGAEDHELLVTHVEAMKRLNLALEKDLDTVVEHHEHVLAQQKQRQIETLHKFQKLIEENYSDKLVKMECLLHELITDQLRD